MIKLLTIFQYTTHKKAEDFSPAFKAIFKKLIKLFQHQHQLQLI
jgi:hypothetical protein